MSRENNIVHAVARERFHCWRLRSASDVEKSALVMLCG
jgi:hypothetical protein